MGSKMKAIILFILFSSIVSAQIINDESLVAYYPLNGDTKDYSGNLLDGSGYNIYSIEDEQGNYNNAYYFTGTNSFIEIPESQKLKAEFPFTISASVLLNEYAVPVFTNDYQEDVYTGALIFISSYGGVCVTLGNGGAIDNTVNSRNTKVGSTVLELHKWYQIGCVVNGFNDIEIYINGEEDFGYYTGHANQLSYSDGSATIGKKDQDAFGPPKSYNGIIDEVYFYNRNLSPNEMYLFYDQTITQSKLSISTSEGEPGDTVSVPLNLELKTEHSLSSLELYIDYPKDLLNYIGYENTSTEVGDKNWEVVTNDTDSLLYIITAGSTNITDAGRFLNLRFLVSNNALTELIPIKIDSCIANTGDIIIETEDGGIRLSNNFEMGDVDMDGQIRAYDASLILQYLVDKISFNGLQTYVADVTNDSTVSALDANLILQYLAHTVDSLPVNNSSVLFNGTGEIKFGDPSTSEDNLSLPINIQNASNIYSFYCEIKYDNSKFDFQETSLSPPLTDFKIEVNLENDVIKIVGVADANDGVKTVLNSDKIECLSVVFKIKDVDQTPSLVVLNKTRLNELPVLQFADQLMLNSTTEVSDDLSPTDYSLSQNFPNPFNPATIINYSIKHQGHVHLSIYNILGQEVLTLVNKSLPAGKYSASLNATNLTSGTYIYKLTSGDFLSHKKMILMK